MALYLKLNPNLNSTIITNLTTTIITTITTTIISSQQQQIIKKFSVVDILGLIMLAMMVFAIITGNVFVITSFITVGRKIRTVTNFFVVNLAISDIFIGLFSVPFWMWVQINRNNLSKTVVLVFVAFDIMCGVASIVNLTLISLERLFAVIHPAAHRNLSRKTHLIVGAIAFVWIFALVNSGLYFVKSFHGWNHYNIYIVFIGFVLPTLVIVGSYVGIYKVAQQHVTEQRRIQQEMRLAGMIAIVIALFIACWFPFFLLNILYSYCQSPICDVIIMRKSIPFVKFLHYSNSMMNPIVYAYRNSDYRQAFKDLLFTIIGKPKHLRRNSTLFSTARTTTECYDDDIRSFRSVSFRSTRAGSDVSSSSYNTKFHNDTVNSNTELVITF